MNILYICHRIPYPPNKGDKIRAFHQIKHLAKEHSVHLACLVDREEDRQHVQPLEKYCASIDAIYRPKAVGRWLAATGFLSRQPLSVAAFYSRRLQEKINQRLSSATIDRIIVFSSAMAEYVKHVSHVPKVMDFVDVDSEKWRTYAAYQPFPLSWLYAVEAERLARYEEAVARTFDHLVLVSDLEARLFQQRVQGRRIAVIPNGVDLDYFRPAGEAATQAEDQGIVFTGEMDYFPNVDAVRHFCDNVLPLVRQEMPGVRFTIVGRNPTRDVKVLGRGPNVTVTGGVSDIRPYLASATVSIAPLRIARGVQNKVLEAMAMGVPVVGTTKALQGILATQDDGIRCADQPALFAQEIVLLLKDAGERRRRATQARQFVERVHRWDKQLAALDELLAAPLA